MLKIRTCSGKKSAYGHPWRIWQGLPFVHQQNKCIEYNSLWNDKLSGFNSFLRNIILQKNKQKIKCGFFIQLVLMLSTNRLFKGLSWRSSLFCEWGYPVSYYFSAVLTLTGTSNNSYLMPRNLKLDMLRKLARLLHFENVLLDFLLISKVKFQQEPNLKWLEGTISTSIWNWS